MKIETAHETSKYTSRRQSKELLHKKNPQPKLGSVYVDASKYGWVERESQVDFTNHPLNNTTVTTGINNNLNPTVTNVATVGKKYKTTEALWEELQDLVSPQFKAWYCKRFHALGKDEVLKLASQARTDGLSPKKLFSYLLKA